MSAPHGLAVRASLRGKTASCFVKDCSNTNLSSRPPPSRVVTPTATAQFESTQAHLPGNEWRRPSRAAPIPVSPGAGRSYRSGGPSTARPGTDGPRPRPPARLQSIQASHIKYAAAPSIATPPILVSTPVARENDFINASEPEASPRSTGQALLTSMTIELSDCNLYPMRYMRQEAGTGSA